MALFRDIPVSMVTRRVFWHSDGQPFRNVATRFSLYGRQLAEEATKKGTEFRRFRFHDLRHRFAVDYLRTGRGGIYELQHELGHTSLKVTEGYLAFLTADEAQAAKETAAQSRHRCIGLHRPRTLSDLILNRNVPGRARQVFGLQNRCTTAVLHRLARRLLPAAVPPLNPRGAKNCGGPPHWPERRIRRLKRWSAVSRRSAMPRRMHFPTESPA